MGEILIKNMEIVVPGEVLAKGMDLVPDNGTFRKNEDIVSSIVGLSSIEGRLVKVIPLTGRYMPKTGDYVIGKITGIKFSSWTVDINSPYEGSLGMSKGVEEFIDPVEDDLSDFYDINDKIYIKVLSVGKNKQIQLTMKDEKARKLTGGKIIEIDPAKVPRVIGRRGSMVKMITRNTKCDVLVGQNGRIWVSGPQENIRLVTRIIKRIEKEAHVKGLTDRIEKMLK